MPIKPVVRGVLIAIPVVVFFAVLLAAGDIVFKQQIINFVDQFDLGRIPEYIARLIIMLFWAYILMGVYLYAALKSTDEKLLGEDKPIISRSLGFTEAAIVLGSVCDPILLICARAVPLFLWRRSEHWRRRLYVLRVCPQRFQRADHSGLFQPADDPGIGHGHKA